MTNRQPIARAEMKGNCQFKKYRKKPLFSHIKKDCRIHRLDLVLVPGSVATDFT
jgi:hypothetical protein